MATKPGDSLQLGLGLDTDGFDAGARKVDKSLSEIQKALAQSKAALAGFQAELSQTRNIAVQAGNSLDKAVSDDFRKKISAARAETARLNAELAKANIVPDNIGGSSLDGAKSRITSLISPTTLLIGALGGLSAAFLSVANSSQAMQNQLKLVTQTEEERAEVAKQLTNISIETSGNLLETTKLYAALARSTESVGANQTQLLAVTKAFNQAVSITGGSSASAAAAITQFNQAMASGVLRGEEFNSINEQAPRLMEALAKGLGVARGELKKLAEDGKLTSDVVLKAILDQSVAINDEFGKMDKTISQAFDSFKTSVGQAAAQSSIFTEVVNLIRDAFLDISAIFQAISSDTKKVASDTENLKAVFKGLGEFIADVVAVATVVFLEFKFVISTVANDITAIARATKAAVTGDFKDAGQIINNAAEAAKRSRAELDKNTKAILEAAKLRRIAETGVGQDEAFVKRATRQSLSSGLKEQPKPNDDKEAKREAERKRKEAEREAERAAREAERANRDAFKAALDAIKQEADILKTNLVQAQQAYDASYKDGLVSLDGYNQARLGIVKAQQEAEIKLIDEQIEASRKELEEAGISAERKRELSAQIQGLTAQRVKAEINAQRSVNAELDAGVQRLDAYAKRMAQVKAQAAEITGNTSVASAQSQSNVDVSYQRELAQVRANGSAEELKALQTIIEAEKASVRLKYEAAEISRQNANVNTQTALLEQQKSAGLITQIDYENQLRALKMQELETQIRIKEATDLTGASDQARIEHARQLAILRGQLTITAQTELQQVQQIAVKMQDSLADAFGQIAGGLQTSQQAFGNWKKQVIGMIGQVVAKLLIAKALSAFGIGGGAPLARADGGEVTVNRATGGIIDVPGKSRSGVADDIVTPIRGGKGNVAISNGEYVVNAASTRAFRPMIEAINAARGNLASLKVPSFAGLKNNVQRLASGGMVGNPSAPTAAIGAPVVNIVNNTSQPAKAEASVRRDTTGQAIIDIVLTNLTQNGQLAGAVRGIANNTR